MKVYGSTNKSASLEEKIMDATNSKGSITTTIKAEAEAIMETAEKLGLTFCGSNCFIENGNAGKWYFHFDWCSMTFNLGYCN